MNAEAADAQLARFDVKDQLMEHIGAARDHILKRVEDPDFHTHELRTRMKKTRSLLRLVVDGIPREVVNAAVARIRFLKESLASDRDAKVLYELVVDLDGDPHWIRSKTGNPAPTIVELVDGVDALALVIQTTDFSRVDRASMLSAFYQSYRDGRRAMGRAVKQGAADRFHTWRKRVKDLVYQSKAFGAPLNDFILQAESLAAVLGREHDLSVLLEVLEAEGKGPAPKAFIEGAIDRRKRLRKEAKEIGTELFDRSRAAFARWLLEHAT